MYKGRERGTGDKGTSIPLKIEQFIDCFLPGLTEIAVKKRINALPKERNAV